MEKIKTFKERSQESDIVVDKQAILNDMVEDLVDKVNEIIPIVNHLTH